MVKDYDLVCGQGRIEAFMACAQPLDYYLLPALDIEDPKVRLKENNGIALDAYLFDDLQPFFFLTERVSLREAA